MPRTFEELIELKRDGGTHTADEMDRIVAGFSAGEMPDYQMSAWLMAAFLNGLNRDETAWMTDAMVRSGKVADLGSVGGVVVDKHSTGGVSDSTTLALGPIVAACGVPVAKMSGRGLGHTGGTLDKLESIPGYQTELSLERFVRQVRDIGLAVIAQSPEIDPADKKIYALRDVTATVESAPFIVSSIVSKKVAGGAEAVLLDVKVGSGAFMKTDAEARALAEELVRVGRVLGRRMRAVITDMDQPLGNSIGNALEVREAMSVLRQGGPRQLAHVVFELAGRMLSLAGVVETDDAGRALAEECVVSGAALERMRAWIAAQGGDARIVDDPGLLPLSARTREIAAPTSGFVAGFDAQMVGRAAMALGAGRMRPQDAIDHGAGLVLAVRVGDKVDAGDLIATLHAADDARLAEGERRLAQAIRFGPAPPEARPLLVDVEA